MFAQLLAIGLVNGSYIALLAMGFALIFGTTRTFHFAHGAIYLYAAYTAYGVAARGGLGLAAGAVAAIAVAAVMGVLFEHGIYRPFRERNASPVAIMLVSLAAFIVLENLLVIFTGYQNKLLGVEVAWLGRLQVPAMTEPIVVTPHQILTVAVALVLFIGLAVFLGVTRRGWAIRAFAEDPELASTAGIPARAIRLWVYAAGSALAAVAAILKAMDSAINPPIGMQAILLATIAVIVGGIGNVVGAAAGGLALGLVQSLGVMYVGSEWQNAVAFGALVLVILCRPRGLLAT